MSIRSMILGLSLLLGAVGCDEAPPGSDGGLTRDAALVDGGGLLDAGAPIGDATVRDAGLAADAGAPLCADAVCDPRSADGCAEGSCVLAGETASCELEAGSQSVGSECADTGACAPGLACFRDGDRGVCGRICCPGDGSACGDGATCGGSGELIDGATTSWGRCLARRSCDVLSPESTCEPREGCYIVDGMGSTECRVAGTAGAGDDCEVQEDCQSGFFCGGVGSRRCVRICEVGAGDCPEGRCMAQAHSPSGTGFCTLDMMTAR
ncbi:MAG: hypothetical protein VYE22_02615 [Myxococcota bacterium]|nr:hypothetical protein [Myxococcota bacterium]